MGFTINKTNRGASKPIYYTDHYRQLVENHLPLIRNDTSALTVTIPTDVAFVCNADFFSVLNHFDVPEHLHWTIMRVNGYSSPTQYRTHVTEILIPSDALLERLLSVHQINHGETNKWD